MNEHTFTLTDAQRDEVIATGRGIVVEAEDLVERLTIGEHNGFPVVAVGMAGAYDEARERVELWTGVLTALGDDA